MRASIYGECKQKYFLKKLSKIAANRNIFRIFANSKQRLKTAETDNSQSRRNPVSAA
jgi:hypothetical protein